MGKSQDGLRFTVVFNDRQDQRGAWSRFGEGGTPHVHTSQVSIFLSQADRPGAGTNPQQLLQLTPMVPLCPTRVLDRAWETQRVISLHSAIQLDAPSVMAHDTALPAAIHLRHCFLKFIDLLPAVYN